MGNWNRRYMPRRKYRYEYEDPPPSPPRTHQTQLRHSGFKHSNAPSWEIDYCNSAQVPWYKILASKKYIFCYPSVAEWDASAAEEALNEAKERYWANINGQPRDKPLPSPDLYIDEIDWNSYIDPELVSDLDRQFFNPDKVDNADQLETINERVDTVTECANAKGNKDQVHSDDPWESNLVKATGNLKDIKRVWNQCNDSVNLKYEDPWEQSDSQLGVFMKVNGWRGENELWGWNSGTNKDWQHSNVDYKSGNPWNTSTETMGARQAGWGHPENSSWGWGLKPNGGEGLWSSGHNKNPRGSVSKSGGYSKGRSWEDEKKTWGWKQSENRNNKADYWDSRRSRKGGRGSNGGYRKRESSPQNALSYKTSRHQGDFIGNSHQR